MRIDLVDGTYELFRHYYALPPHQDEDGRDVAAIRGVLSSILSLIGGGATHVGVATDHVIESFRNRMWADYKTSEGIEPALLAQFHPLEDALEVLGITVWRMVEYEADDALASAAAVAWPDPAVEQIRICSPDKDVAQCVQGRRVVQVDRRREITFDESGVVGRFGVKPASIPDYLALVGDSADGFPGLEGWGPKSASALLARYGTLEAIPDDASEWAVKVRGAPRLAHVLASQRERALLFKDLATLRTCADVGESVAEWEWRGPTDELAALCKRLRSAPLAERAREIAVRRDLRPR
jgi:5'-3' exonuclease